MGRKLWPSLATVSEDDSLLPGIIQSFKVGIEFAVQTDVKFFTTVGA